MTNDSPERQNLSEIFHKSTDWPEAFQKMQQETQRGTLSSEYETVTRAIEQAYQSLSTEGRRGLSLLPTDAKVAIVTLAASTARVSLHEGQSEAQEVSQFVQEVTNNSAQHGQRAKQGLRKITNS